jgi:putative transcriptional regulator
MSKAGQSILRGARQALAHAKGDVRSGVRVHVPENVDVKAVRHKMKLTQEEFAAQFGFALSVIRDWEQGRYQPDRSARVLLKVVEKEPQAVRRALTVA